MKASSEMQMVIKALALFFGLGLLSLLGGVLEIVSGGALGAGVLLLAACVPCWWLIYRGARRLRLLRGATDSGDTVERQ